LIKRISKPGFAAKYTGKIYNTKAGEYSKY